MNFGEKLKQLRIARNMTQPQLAEAIGIEQSYLSKLENDKSLPSAEMFQAIMKTLEMDVKNFLCDLDKNIIHGPLRQIPEVANYVNASFANNVHKARKWLFGSATACVLGITLIVAGQMGFIFSKYSYSYFSEGILKKGESEDIFSRFDKILTAKLGAELSSREELAQEKYVFETTRIKLETYHTEKDEGAGFHRDVEGGYRYFSLMRTTPIESTRNHMLMLFGVLLSFAGLFGFVLEYRLRNLGKGGSFQ